MVSDTRRAMVSDTRSVLPRYGVRHPERFATTARTHSTHNLESLMRNRLPHPVVSDTWRVFRTGGAGGTCETCGVAKLSPSLGLGQLRQQGPRGDDGWPTKGKAIDILAGQCEGNLKRMRRLERVLNGEKGFGERR